MSFRHLVASAAVLAGVTPAACSAPDHGKTAGASAGALTSIEATIIDFEFDGEVITDAGANPRDAIVRQLLYTFGVLRTADEASGQIGNVRLSDLTESGRGNAKRVGYHAVLPVAWTKDAPKPTSYELVFPRDVTALQAFDEAHDGECGKGDHGEGNFWHDWNPRAQGCALGGDVVRAVATVTAHEEPQLRFPEYDRIWSDGRLDVAALFTIIESPGMSNDWGYTEAERFVKAATAPLRDVRIQRNRASPSILVDLSATGTAVIGGVTREVAIDALVIDKVTDVGADFDARYDALSERADLILFNGHARLGANTNALGRKGKVVGGKYQLVLLNACDTFALVDATMRDRRRDANGDADPYGTRFLDVISNAHPGRSDHLASVSLDVYRAALGWDEPASYGRIIGGMPKEQVAVVFGEEDNSFMAVREMPVVYEQAALSGF